MTFTVPTDSEASGARAVPAGTWTAPLPGGGVALGTHVTITVNLELALADDGED